MATDTQASRLMAYVQQQGIVRPRELEGIGVDRRVLKRLVDRGELMRRSRGVYTMPDHEPTSHTDLAEVCARVEHATICLISALSFHELTTQVAHDVWIMIDHKGRAPKLDSPSIRVIRASGKSRISGVEQYDIEGVRVPITTPAKTVADCFKYRDHVGQNVAIEALKDCLRQRKATPSQIFEMSQIDRVAKTIRPYIEALA
jgi:predicted transcriptional regulator of viral defense system